MNEKAKTVHEVAKLTYTVNYPYCSNFKPPFPAARF